jgi:hypothetical protein
MRLSLKNFIIPSIPLAVFLVGFCVALWASEYNVNHTDASIGVNSILSNDLQSIFLSNSFLANVICLAFTLLNTFLIAQINNRFTIIRTRTFLPIFIFLLLSSTWSQTHMTISSQLGLTLIIFALFNFFNMSRNNDASEQAFMGSLLISVSSLLINPFIFLIPICWIGFMIFQSLSLKTFLASLFGALTPWILYLSVIYLLNPSINFYTLFTLNPVSPTDFSTIKLIDTIYSLSIILTMIIGIFAMFSITHSDAIYTRNKLNFLLLLLVALSGLIFIFKNQFECFLPVVAFVYALLLSHPLTLKQSNFYGILFSIFCVVNIVFVVLKHILP